jgi:hypothetical protein
VTIESICSELDATLRHLTESKELVRELELVRLALLEKRINVQSRFVFHEKHIRVQIAHFKLLDDLEVPGILLFLVVSHIRPLKDLGTHVEQ